MSKHLSQHQIQNLKSLLSDEKEYRKHIDNLRRTRDGLYNIMETRPELSGIISPQWETLKDIVFALLPKHPSIYPYPPYNDKAFSGSEKGTILPIKGIN